MLEVAVDVPSVPDATLVGDLCLPEGETPQTVQILVHGGTYTRAYWDWPLGPDRYSYVRDAVDAGYATFSVDRLGAGESTRPPSALNTLEAGATALHDVITQLRDGSLGGIAFDRVVWVGHSFGSVYGWVEASLYDDVDALVLTGAAHHQKPSFTPLFVANSHLASTEPQFAGLDDGYLTTTPGSRGLLFYYLPTAEQAVIDLDEQLKDTITTTELFDLVALLSAPPEAAITHAIQVPTLEIVGKRDNISCGPPDGIDCSQASLTAFEQNFFSPQAQLRVVTMPSTGHDLNLHITAPATYAVALDWLASIGIH